MDTGRTSYHSTMNFSISAWVGVVRKLEVQNAHERRFHTCQLGNVGATLSHCTCSFDGRR